MTFWCRYVPILLILGAKNSSKSIDKFDGARNDTATCDDESVTSMDYYNTTTSQVRFAIDLDVNNDQSDSEDERWSWEKDEPEPFATSEEIDNAVYRETKTSETKDSSPPRSGRFSITKFPTISSTTKEDVLTSNG